MGITRFIHLTPQSKIIWYLLNPSVTSCHFSYGCATPLNATGHGRGEGQIRSVSFDK